MEGVGVIEFHPSGKCRTIFMIGNLMESFTKLEDQAPVSELKKLARALYQLVGEHMAEHAVQCDVCREDIRRSLPEEHRDKTIAGAADMDPEDLKHAKAAARAIQNDDQQN